MGSQLGENRHMAGKRKNKKSNAHKGPRRSFRQNKPKIQPRAKVGSPGS